MEHVSALSKELDTRARVFEDDADFIVEVREGSSDADLDPNFELKNLGLRFENWKRDFKDRLRETRLMLKRLDKLENGIGGDDAFDDAYAYGYREDDAYPSREDAYGDEEEEENDYERVDARDRGKEPKKRRWGLKRAGTEEMNCDGTIRIASRCDVRRLGLVCISLSVDRETTVLPARALDLTHDGGGHEAALHPRAV